MVSVMNTIETGHSEDISDVQIDYYGLMMATCASDRVIKIFNLKTQELVADLKGHLGPINELSWAHPKFGPILASCSFDKTVILWKEERNWMKMQEFQLSSAVTCVQFAPYQFGLVLACGTTDGKVNIFSFEHGGNWNINKFQAHHLGCNTLCWEPAVDDKQYLVTGGSDNCIKIWEANLSSGWEEVAKLDIHQERIVSVAWAPSTTTNMIASCSDDKTVVISTSTDKKKWSSKLLHTFQDAVCAVTWGQNILAVSTVDKNVSLWKENPAGQWVCISESNINSAEPNAQ